MEQQQQKETAQKIVQDYFVLVEKSQQLFAGLRDLPQFGRHWQPYFQKTFEIYTKLWKFQQQHRAVLENKEIYGLKRWEIGEIASKIGQLYYHYYLRTSETNYIEEAFIFYEAIRQRDYFKDVFDTKNALLVVKKLRYYARFIVVCLLLNRRSLVLQLVEELQTLVEQYVKEFKPPDAPAWRLVLQEVTLFLQVDCPLEITDRNKDTPVSNRLKALPSASEGKIKLQEAILVGNYQNQVKFSELTLDMFRIMQALERDKATSAPRSASDGEGGELKQKKRSNPHKFLLYRPSFPQLLVFLSTAFKELHDNNVLLLYISADGLKPEEGESDKDAEHRYSLGGVSMNESSTAAVVPRHSVEYANCLYPEDITPFTRKKLFLIVESNNSVSFKSLPTVFGKPFLCLLSPVSRDYTVEVRGNLFTLFLYAPLTAFCFVVSKNSVSQEVFDRCTKHIESSFEDMQNLLCNFEGIPPAYHEFIEEDFLQSFILRFIFCHSVIYLHKNFRAKPVECRPSSHPPLPKSFLSHPVVLSVVYKLASALGVSNQFSDPSELEGSA